MTGELAGHAVSALLAAGALDAWAVPIVMKKGRPALTLAAIGPSEQADVLAQAMLRETSSIGVRILPLRRLERPRRIVEVTTPYGIIPVKISTGPYGPAVMKPEFDACARAAQASHVSVRDFIAAALDAPKTSPTDKTRLDPCERESPSPGSGFATPAHGARPRGGQSGRSTGRPSASHARTPPSRNATGVPSDARRVASSFDCSPPRQ
jgi:hypothetical protein